MNETQLIDRLNQQMNREISSLLRHMLQAASLGNPEYGSMRKLYTAEVMEEVQHAQDLADQIEFLGETPRLDPDLTSPPRDIKTMMARDAENNREDEYNYRHLAELADNVCLYYLKLEMEVRSDEKNLYRRKKHRMLVD